MILVQSLFSELRGPANVRCPLTFSRCRSETTLAPTGESKEVEYFFASDARSVCRFSTGLNLVLNRFIQKSVTDYA